MTATRRPTSPGNSALADRQSRRCSPADLKLSHHLCTELCSASRHRGVCCSLTRTSEHVGLTTPLLRLGDTFPSLPKGPILERSDSYLGSLGHDFISDQERRRIGSVRV